MEVTAEVVGEGEQELSLAEDATYADVARAVGYSPHEVSLFVDGTPVPADQAVDVDRVRVLRLVSGGAGVL